MNCGKQFENDIKSSTYNEILLYRIHDSAQSFGSTNDLRFSLKNPFDYLLWDSVNRNLYALELKTVSGKSISFERSKEEKGIIHHHQIVGLRMWNQYKGVICGFIIEFRQIEKTIFLTISDFDNMVCMLNKKSFSFDDLISNSIRFVEIPRNKLRTHYRYDLFSFIEQTKEYTK